MSWFTDNPPSSGGVPRTTLPMQTPGLQPSTGGDPQATFFQIMGNLPGTPQNLESKAAELQAAGFTLVRSGDGTAGKVSYQGGPAIDVVNSAKLGGRGAFQWLPYDGGTSQGAPGAPGGTLGSMMGGANYGARLPALEKTPGYPFRFDQGRKMVEGSAAAKGTLLTGGAAKDLTEFGQGLASTEFDNEYRRLFGMAELGYNAAGAQGNYGTSYGSNLTDLTTGSGNARANAALTSGNAWGGTAANLGAIGGGVVSRWPTQQNPYGYGYPPNPYDPYQTQRYSASGGAGGGGGW